MKKNKEATQKQANNVAEGQLMAMFGETIESAEEITAEFNKKKKAKKKNNPQEKEVKTR